MTKNARFWVWGKEGAVKLTLKPGQILNHYHWERTDEGWSSRLDTWTFDEDDGFIYNNTVDDGRDCDGRLTTRYLYRVHTSKLPFPCTAPPLWEEVKPASVYDEYAQAANY